MTSLPQNPVVWAEIPVTDMEKAMAFYTTVTGYTMTLSTDGPNPMAIFDAAKNATTVAGHLYPGKPAEPGTGPTVHLAVSDSVEQAMDRVKKAGGTVVSPTIEIPTGRFAYCLDPDGNSFGVFESK